MGLSTSLLTAMHAGIKELPALADHVARDKRAVVKAIQQLKKRELVITYSEEEGIVSGPARGSYELTPAGIQIVLSGKAISPGQGARPRIRTIGLRERAWWELRAHKLASLKQIISTHAEGTEKAADINLYKYLVALEKAGVLTRMGRRIPAKQSKGRVQWSLTLDLGPKAPVWRQAAREVFDPNSGKVYPMKGAGDE